MQECSSPPVTDSTTVTEPSPASAHNCDVCGLVFSSEHFLKIHKDIIHSKSNFFDVTCKLCKKKFKDLESYRNHVRETHSDRRYMCDQCPKTFKLRGSLVVHTRMFHDPSSPGACHTCNKTFTTRARRELHERRYHGRVSPSGKASPPRHNKNISTHSSLSDAKNWLETLMSENKTGTEERGGVVQTHSTPSLPHHTPTHFLPPQASPHNGADQTQTKGYQQLQQQPEEAQMVIKTPVKQAREQQEWGGSEVPAFPSSQDQHNALQLYKSPADVYLPSYKTNIVFPCQVMQQNLGLGRSRPEYTELKEEKKVGVEMGSNRIVSGHVQGSPVAVVSPQPHKSETPPGDAFNQDAGHIHTEARRNSFPLVSPNKLCVSQSETVRLHPTACTGELSLGESDGLVAGMSLAGIGDKAGLGHQLVYQHCHNMVPCFGTGVGLLSPDSKAGLRVPPLLLPGSQYPQERMKEIPDSPVQSMDVQKDPVTCEVRPMMVSQAEGRQTRLEQQQQSDTVPAPVPAHPPLTLAPVPPPAPPHSRKEGGGRADNKQWECEVCKKSFTTKYFLKKHKRLHTGETPYACEECGKTFTFQQSYHKHVLYHSDDKPHQCSYCGRAFKEMSTLHNHVRIHTGEKPFVCETCGKAFRQRVSYLVHQRIHTGVMPYTCNVCHRSFRYKVSLRSHKCEPSVASSSGTNTSTKDTHQDAPTKPSPPLPPPPPPPPPPHPHLPRPPALTVTTTTTTSPHPPQPPPPPPPPSRADMTSATCLPGVSETGSSQVLVDNMHQDLTSRMRPPPPLETIDAAAISCDTLGAQDCKQFQQNRHKSGSHGSRVNHGGQESQASRGNHQGGHEFQSSRGGNQGGHDFQPSRGNQGVHEFQVSKGSSQGGHEFQASRGGSQGGHEFQAGRGSQGGHEFQAGRGSQEGHEFQASRGNSQGGHETQISRVGGSQGGHDPLSMAFLHALVDPNQARIHGECRPLHHSTTLPPPDTLPFPSLSPGTIDADMDHDSFLTNLLM